MLLNFGNISIYTVPINSKYIVVNEGVGFFDKDHISKLLKENNLDDCVLSNISEDTILWEKDIVNKFPKLKFFVNVNNNIVEAVVDIKSYDYDININTTIKGINGLKLLKDVELKLLESETFTEELSKVTNTMEGRIRSKIDEDIGDIVILTEEFEFIDNNGVLEAVVPVSLGDSEWKAPILLARISVINDSIDISDVEDKINHLLMAEDIPARMIERVKKKSRIKYRRFKNNGDSTEKRPKTPDTSVNRGHQ